MVTDCALGVFIGSGSSECSGGSNYWWRDEKRAEIKGSRKALLTMVETLFFYLHVTAIKNMDVCEKKQSGMYPNLNRMKKNLLLRSVVKLP